MLLHSWSGTLNFTGLMATLRERKFSIQKRKQKSSFGQFCLKIKIIVLLTVKMEAFKINMN